jgi:hypothetical protein
MQEYSRLEGASRRALLKGLASTAAGAALPILGQNPPPQSHHSSAPVTGQDSAVYEYRCFDREEAKTLDALCETIIPADSQSPGASAARVSEYIDLIVAEASQEVRDLWKQGIAATNELAANSYGRSFAECPPDHQIAVMAELAGSEDPHGSLQERFFHILKRATIDGYYTSRIGIHQDLQYHGNEAAHDFPGCGQAGGR